MELFKILGTVAIDGSGAKSELQDVTNVAEESHGKISGVFEKIGSAAVTLGKTMAAGLAVGTAAIGALVKDSVAGYANYEQLVGGVETLFGRGGKTLEEYAESVGKTVEEVTDEYHKLAKAETTVLRNADKAFNDAGMSVNDYMETVTSFSASLIQSLDGDTEAAAEKANMAIIDMSDNANKMGSNISSIQNAYQGFAKQNFSMLDNLKLGYGGTQAEMFRLMQDAAELDATFAENAVFSLDAKGHLEAKYSDIVDAIHIIQTEMGITGTTAAEASGTISGSFSAMKAAWENLVTGLGNEDADLSGLIEQFVAKAETVLHNVMPRIELILGGITDLIAQLMPKIAEKLPELLNTMLPSLIEAAVQLINGLVQALPTILQILIEQIPYIVTEIGKGLTEAFPVLLETVKTLFGQIWDYISLELLNTGVSFEDAFTKMSEIFNTAWTTMQQIWADYGQPVWEKVSGVVQTLMDEVLKPLYETYLTNLKNKFDVVVETCGIVATAFYENVQPAIETIVDKFGELAELIQQAVEEYILPVIQSFVDMIQELWEENKDKLELISELFVTIFNMIAENVTKFVEKFKEKFMPFLEEIKNFVTENLDKIKATFQKAIDFVTGIIKFFIAFFKGDWEGMWQAIKDTLEAAFLFIRGVFELIGAAIADKVIAIKESISTKFEEIKNSITEKIQAAKDKVVEIFDSIASKIEEKINNAKDTVKTAIDKIKEFFNFNVELPSIKLPHFSIQPSGWQLGDLLEGSIPSLGIDWYAKGGVMEEPTVFGRNGNNLMVGGEAGAEAIAPIDVLQGYIAQAVASQNAALVAVLQKILEAILAMDENMGGNLRDALENTAFEVNHREFARLVKAVN